MMRRTLTLALIGSVLVTAMCVHTTVVLAPLGGFLITGTFCSAAQKRFSQRLAEDPMAVRAPAGIARVTTRVFQPCEGNGDWVYYGGVTVGWAYSDPAQSDLALRFYRDLGAAEGWEMTDWVTGGEAPSRRLLGKKTIDGTYVGFLLVIGGDHWKDGRPIYWVELSYQHLSDAKALSIVEGTNRIQRPVISRALARS